MKKSLKKLICLSISILMVIGCFVFTTSAASTAISLSSSSVTVGSKITVTVSLNADEEIMGGTIQLTYNADVLKWVNTGGDVSGGAGAIKILLDPPAGSKKASCVLNFDTIKAGTSTIQIKECIAVDTNAVEKSITGSSVNVTVKDATKSGDANLKSLRLTDGTLSPEFSKDVTSYTATIPYSVTECKVYTRTSDSSAQVAVEGSATMKVGENTRTVVVTAPNGNQKRYKIVITRLPEGEGDQPTEEPQENSNKVVISGTDYEILSDLGGIAVPKGFLIAQAEYNGTKVATLEDENGKYLIYYLKNTKDNKNEPFVLDEDTKSFKKLPYITSGNDFYILEDVDDTKGIPVGTQISSVNINGNFVSGFIPENDNMVGFYYVTCYIDGVSGFYRYDSEMNTLQREMGLIFGENTMSFDVEETGDNFFARFGKLNTAAKLVVIGVVLIFVIIIALIVIVIIQAVKSRKRDSVFTDEQMVTTGDDGFVFSPEDIPENTQPSADEEQAEPEEEIIEEATEEFEEQPEVETEEEPEEESEEPQEDEEE
ncbi:MAG: cadherin-like beta sandwich domain-containing protein [Clostridia bacterium]|nr:cadherin-like beta sandwich domain-containing protein [Clostridia bacterium]MBP3627023.1 cadherin-like beta sandwich domain-containing protein [Clostridia bacterium]